MNEFLSGSIPIDKFIEHHNNNFVNYCEVVILANGDVQYCIPSHQETLIRLSNIPRDKLWNEIYGISDVLLELCNKAKCIAVWFDFYVRPDNVTIEQLNSLKKLNDAGCINVNIEEDIKGD